MAHDGHPGDIGHAIPISMEFSNYIVAPGAKQIGKKIVRKRNWQKK